MCAKFINILRQLYIIVFKYNSYPSCYLFEYWEYYITKDNKTAYNQWKTLKNYIFNHKTI